jgi:DNA-binding response OmpR family regulator
MKGKKILAVEDDPTALGALRQILSEAGYEVVTAQNGEEALAAMKADRPNLVLLDVAMPGLSGFEVCRRIRAEPENKNLPVIFLSARAEGDARAEGQAAGSDLYLAKPVLASRLLTMVELFL